MRGLVVVLLLVLCTTTTTYANPADILVDASTNIINGVVSGFIANEINTTVNPTCVGGYSMLVSVDNFVNLMLNTSNTTVQIITPQIEAFSRDLNLYLISPLKMCGVAPTTIQQLMNAIPLLNNVQELEYNTTTLLINNVDLYETIASMVSEYTESNFHTAGFYLGVALRMLSGLPSGQLECNPTEDTTAALSAMYATLLQTLGDFADVEEGEKVIFSLNIASEWSWCGGAEKNYTGCDVANNFYTEDISNALDTIAQFGTDRYNSYGELFSNMYYEFIMSIDPFNTTLDDVEREYTVLAREAGNRYTRDYKVVAPLYEAYTNSTPNAANFTTWASTICNIPMCATVIQEYNLMDELYDELLQLFGSSAAVLSQQAQEDFNNPDNMCVYQSWNGYNVSGLAYDISLMPNQYVQNQKAGLYQGGFYFSASSNVIKENSCTSDFNIPAALQEEIQEAGMLQFNKNGTWHNVEVDWLHNNFSYVISARSFTRVKVSPRGWFEPSILWRFRNATDLSGRPAAYWFDPNYGVLSSMVTGVLVATEVEVNVAVSEQSGSAIFDKFGDAVDGVKFGPFFASGFRYSYGDGGVKVNLNTQPQNNPQVIGYVIKQLPYEA